MALRDYRPPTRSIDVPGNDLFVVRGLSLTDIAQVSRAYKDEIEPLFAKVRGQAAVDTVESFDLKMLGGFLLQSAPDIAALTIALALDAPPEEVAIVKKLPIQLQIELIYAIGELTFQGEGGAKKVLQIVTNMFVGARGLAIGNATP